MSAPLVTIVTPSFNQGEFIRATIESVLGQNYPFLEYIIMDGGSTDQTAAVARDYASRLTFISEPDRGQSHAINKAFARARGSIVAWINSDDILLPWAASAAVRAFAAHPNAGLIYGDGYLMDREGNLTCRFPYTRPFDLWRLANLSDYILQQSTFFRRAVFYKTGWLREDLRWAFDWEIFLRIGKRFPLVRVPGYFGCLREYPETKTGSGGLARILEIHSVLREHTGSRFAPGSFLYAIDPALDWIRSRIRHATPAALTPIGDALQMAVTHAAHAVAGRLASASNGWHPDGWFARRLDCWLPAGNGPLALEGDLPARCGLEGQSLSLAVNGAPLGRFPLVPGPFRIDTRVAGQPPDRHVVLEIRAARTFVPAIAWPPNPDYRRLAGRLHRLRWQGCDYLPPGVDPHFP